MIIVLSVLTLFLQIIQANGPYSYYQALIHFHQLVCPNHTQMFVMAEKYGIQKVLHPPPNIFLNPNYGYYELFICKSNARNISSGCALEIMNEYNFRYAHVPTLELSFLIDNYMPKESHLVRNGKFDLCIIDGTYSMLNHWMLGPNYSFPSLYDRLQMPRKCWRIKLVPMQIDMITQEKMDNALRMKLQKYKNQRTRDYIRQIISMRFEITEFTRRMKEQEKKIKELEQHLERLGQGTSNYENTENQIKTIVKKLETEKITRSTMLTEEKHIETSYEKKVEEESIIEEQSLKNKQANQVPNKTEIDGIDHEGFDNTELLNKLNEMRVDKRRKRETTDFIDKLKKIKPKKQIKI